MEIVAPVASAVAAAASWTSVFLMRRGQMMAEEPRLVFHLGTRSAPPLELTVHNIGRGTAIFPGVTVLSGDGRAAVADAADLLAPDDRLQFDIPFMTTPAAMGVAHCEDRFNQVHAWSADGKYERYRKGGKRGLTDRGLFGDLYGEDAGRQYEAVSLSWVTVSPK